MFDYAKEEQYQSLKQKFDTYYDEKLVNLLRKNDEKRHKYYAMFLGLLCLSLFLYPAIIYYILAQGLFIDDNTPGIIINISIFFVIILSGPIMMYRKTAKQGIMQDFANFFGIFNYEYQKCLPNSIILQSQLFKNYNYHQGDDFFYGKYKDVDITISEEKMLNITQDFRHNDIKKKVFKGVCILLQMNKNFKCRTVVLKDKGLFNVFQQIDDLERIKLEDIQFEKLWEVYANDQIEARFLLTTGFMERMLKLRELFEGENIQFSFFNNQLLISISTNQNMFEASSFFRSNVNKKRIDNTFNQFYTVLSVIDVLKLNQHLGM